MGISIYSQVQVRSGNLVVARKPLTHRTIILGVQQKIKVYRNQNRKSRKVLAVNYNYIIMSGV